MLCAVITLLGQLPTVSKQTCLFVCLFVNFIFEILVFWRAVCLNLCGRLVLQTEGQLHSNKDVRTEFVILTATS